MTQSRPLLWASLALLLILILFVAGNYITTNLQASGESAPIMPLDDAYIHFQYARSIAEGHPYRYNPEQAPTSGATSLLYPLLLAAGYALGFKDLALGWWALALGLLAWSGAALVLFALIWRQNGGWLALIFSAAFVLTGSIAWAAASGMETTLLILFSFVTLFGLVERRPAIILIGGVLATITRPEGIALGVVAWAYWCAEAGSRRVMLRRGAWFLVLIAAGAAQPLLNFVLTGSASAAGLQAKSYLYNVPFDWLETARLIVTTGLRAARNLIWNPEHPITAHGSALILVGVVGLLIAPPTTRRLSAMILMWITAIIGAASLLETAFWQMERYQQPVIALLYPLAGLALVAPISAANGRRGNLYRWVHQGRWIFGITALMQAAWGTGAYLMYYRGNVAEVAGSQVPMARWVAANVPAEAIIGVHDIGVMRYLGNHTTYDIIGLTTAGGALAWRNGPGAAFEQMRGSPLRPSYFAIYPDARGLTYFQGTGLFRRTLASFPSVTKAWYNVASATQSGQQVYEIDWSTADRTRTPLQTNAVAAIGGYPGKGFQLVDQINVGDLSDERAHGYRFGDRSHNGADGDSVTAGTVGFASEVREMTTIACQPTVDNPTCVALDGTRTIGASESFTISVQPDRDLIWVARVHPQDRTSLTVNVDGLTIPTPVMIPMQAGQWLELVTLIPKAFLGRSQAAIEIRVNNDAADSSSRAYRPAYHWFYQGAYVAPTATITGGLTDTFMVDPENAVNLESSALNYDAAQRQLIVQTAWSPVGFTRGIDAKLFVHLYDQAGLLREDAQSDQRLGGGAIPLSNLLPGVLNEQSVINLPASVPAGRYRVAIGLYQADGDQARLMITGETADLERRLFIGEIEVK